MPLNCGVGEDSWESLACKQIKPINPKGNQSWTFIGRTDAEAETSILWPPDAKNWLLGKDPDAGKDWRQEEKGMTEDEMVGWHHWHNGHEFEQAPGVGDEQGSLACCSPWSHKEIRLSDWTDWFMSEESPFIVFLVQVCCLQILLVFLHLRLSLLHPLPTSNFQLPETDSLL